MFHRSFLVLIVVYFSFNI